MYINTPGREPQLSDSPSGTPGIKKFAPFTYLPWRNASVGRDPETGRPIVTKVMALTGPMTQYAIGTVTTSHTPGVHHSRLSPPGVEHAGIHIEQSGYVLAPHTRKAAIDVDTLAYAGTRLASLLPLDLAMSRRGEGGHIGLHMDEVPPEEWPTQGPIVGGDFKANGFIPVPGSLHKSGELYRPTGMPFVVCTPEILEAIREARQEWEELYRPRGDSGPSPAASGRHSAAGERSEGTGDDDELRDLVWRMLHGGYDRDEVYRAWRKRADEIESASWPFTDRDFDRHYGDETRGAYYKVVVAGHSDLPPCSGLPEVTPADLVDLRKQVNREALITADDPEEYERKVLAKLAAEESGHVRSIDYRGSPAGTRAVLRAILVRVAGGEEVTRATAAAPMMDPARVAECLEWILAQPYLLHETAGGILLPAADRQRLKEKDLRWVGGHLVNFANYPGCPDGENPEAGDTWGRDALAVVRQAIAALQHDGEGATGKQIAEYVTRNLRPEGKRCMSIDVARRARKALVERGQLVELRPIQHYRDRHAWATLPALYAMVDTPRSLEDIRAEIEAYDERHTEGREPIPLAA